MVCAEFPGAAKEQLNEIHSWLSQRNWVPVNTPGDELTNVWHGTFKNKMLEKDCREVTIKSFMEAAKSYCKVELEILWAATKPITDGLNFLK
jgi:hypothetical protein